MSTRDQVNGKVAMNTSGQDAMDAPGKARDVEAGRLAHGTAGIMKTKDVSTTATK